METKQILKLENELKEITIRNENYLNENYLKNLNNLDLTNKETLKFLINMKILDLIINNSNYLNKL